MGPSVPPSRREAIAALVGLPALSAFLEACGRSGAKAPGYEGEIVGEFPPTATEEELGIAMTGGARGGEVAA